MAGILHMAGLWKRGLMSGLLHRCRGLPPNRSVWTGSGGRQGDTLAANSVPLSVSMKPPALPANLVTSGGKKEKNGSVCVTIN